MNQQDHTPLPSKLERRLRRLQARGRLVLFIEDLWPRLLPALGVMALFIFLSLINFWSLLPWLTHYILLGAFAGALTFFLVRNLHDLHWPSAEAANARLQQDGKVRHHALEALEDKPFANANSQNPLWQQHLRAMGKAARRARLDKPHATIDARDPFALRYGILLVLGLALFLNRQQLGPLFYTAFHPGAANQSRLAADIWITPPAYTGLPATILISGDEPSAQNRGAQSRGNEELPSILQIPAGATLEVRLSGVSKNRFGRPKLSLLTPSETIKIKLQSAQNGLTASSALTSTGTLVLRANRQRWQWPIEIMPDRPPIILWRAEPTPNQNGTLELTAEIGDDYGIEQAWAIIRLEPDQQRPDDLAPISDVAARQVKKIPLASIRGKEGARKQVLDLSDLPWAGLQAQIRLDAIDGAGQSASTSTKSVRLPKRKLYNPLAQAIAHERTELAIAPHRWPNTGRALDALTLAPDRFFENGRDYLLIRTSYWEIMNGRGENIDQTVEALWPLALQLEDKELALARRALDEAEQALREALENGASDEEINRLVEELRMAMNNYIEALANSGEADLAAGENSQNLDGDDLNDLLDQMRDLSQSGAKNAAQQLLSELETMLQNLRIDPGSTGRGGQSAGNGQNRGQNSGQGRGNGEGSGDPAMRAMGEMIAKQRELMDQSWTTARGNRDGTPTPSPEELAQRQRRLADQLGQFKEALGAGGAGSTEAQKAAREARNRFEDAWQSMEQAAEALQNGNPGVATTAQGEALNALREGAGALAEARAGQKQTGQGQADAAGTEGFKGQAVDPLGRPYSTRTGEEALIPDFSDPERARELIEEVRRRLSQPGRSQEEIDYLERLLERF